MKKLLLLLLLFYLPITSYSQLFFTTQSKESLINIGFDSINFWSFDLNTNNLIGPTFIDSVGGDIGFDDGNSTYNLIDSKIYALVQTDLFGGSDGGNAIVSIDTTGVVQLIYEDSLEYFSIIEAVDNKLYLLSNPSWSSSNTRFWSFDLNTNNLIGPIIIDSTGSLRYWTSTSNLSNNKIYVVAEDTSGKSYIFSIDTTGGVQLIYEDTVESFVSIETFNNKIYIISYHQGSNPNPIHFYTIDINTNNIITGPIIIDSTGMEYHNSTFNPLDNKIYIIRNGSSNFHDISSIDTNGVILLIYQDSTQCLGIIEAKINNSLTSVNEILFHNSKKLIKTINLLGQESLPYQKNILLFYIYSDGTVEKKIIIE